MVYRDTPAKELLLWNAPLNHRVAHALRRQNIEVQIGLVPQRRHGKIRVDANERNLQPLLPADPGQDHPAKHMGTDHRVGLVLRNAVLNLLVEPGANELGGSLPGMNPLFAQHVVVHLFQEAGGMAGHGDIDFIQGVGHQLAGQQQRVHHNAVQSLPGTGVHHCLSAGVVALASRYRKHQYLHPISTSAAAPMARTAFLKAAR